MKANKILYLPKLRSATQDEILTTLVELQIKEDEFLLKTEEAGLTLCGYDSLLGNYRYLNIAADMVGIPREAHDVSYEQISNDPNFYCRDWIADYFDELAVEKNDIARFIAELKQEGEKWKHEHNSNNGDS